MAARFLKHIALEIPKSDRGKAMDFYNAFGLKLEESEKSINFKCYGRDYPSLLLIPGAKKKRLHHVAMGCSESDLQQIKRNMMSAGISVLKGPTDFASHGLWLESSEGILFNIDVCSKEQELPAEAPFLINSPGYNNRVNVGVLPPKSEVPEVRPRKLGHALLFTPDLDGTINFLETILDMRLSDRSQGAVAFLHCQGGSDHHVIALAQSSAVGLHHVSFMVATPDEVGFGGCSMIENGYDQHWGFGRHTIGSNFFHYIRDPWGSYVEYYADIDYIADSEGWDAKNWPLEDSLHAWGPPPPKDFVHNYETE